MIKLDLYNKKQIKNNLKNRNITDINVDLIFNLYDLQKEKQKNIEELRHAANIAAKEKNYEAGGDIKKKLKILEPELEETNNELLELLRHIPNVLDDSVPFGVDHNDNVVVKQNGNLIFHKHHYEMDMFLDCTDFTGSRFVALKDKFAQLERALISFMMDHLINNGFIEFSAPCIMNENGLKNSEHFPRLHDDMFKIEGENKYLIPTSETIMVNIGKNKRWDEDQYFCMITDCFRKEAGSAGKDTKGLIRVHQFKKCEMVCYSQPENSYKMLDKMLEISSAILEKLQIPYRVLLLCSGDTGFTSAKTFDLEVPIGGQWREIASISNCLEFQACNINCRNSSGKFLHILNGSALAVGRTLATLVEVHFDPKNNQINIPIVLHKYLNFTKIDF